MGEPARASVPRSLSGIVLAGGRSSRFGRDKLREPIDGVPLLHRAAHAVAALASEVVFVASPRGSIEVPLLAVDTHVVHDPIGFAGPLEGLVTGLMHARYPEALVVAGDMPALQHAVLRLLVGRLHSSRMQWAGATLANDERNAPAMLPLALRRMPALIIARRHRRAGRASLRSLLTGLWLDVIPEAEWRPLDPDGLSLMDIDEPSGPIPR